MASGVAVTTEVCLEQSYDRHTLKHVSTEHSWSRSYDSHPWSRVQQTVSGATLNRANRHPNDHHPPLSIVYMASLYPSFCMTSLYFTQNKPLKPSIMRNGENTLPCNYAI